MNLATVAAELELRGLKNFAETIQRDHTTRLRERRRYSMLRRTGKPHIYRESWEWLILERTAPGEWWLSPLPTAYSALRDVHA